MMITVFEMVENTVWEWENTGYQYILFFQQCFS